MSNKRADAAKKRRASQAKAKPKVTKSGAKPSSPPKTKPRITSSTTRAARKKAGTKPNVTASGGGSARTKGGPNKADANRWKQLNNSAKTSGKGPFKGAPGTVGAPTNAKPAERTAKGQTTANKMKRITTATKAARSAAGKAAAAKAVGKAGALGAAAAAGINAGPVADGTMKNKPTGEKKGPPAPKAKPNLSFDDSFRAARAAGVKEFTWKGKKYHTRRADGK